jgi:hypothetical protein
MGYLVCNNCEGYYELQEGENPEDFNLTCECGGKLQYKKSIKSDNSNWKIDLKALLVGLIITYFLAIFSYIGGQYYFLSYFAPAVGGFLTSYMAKGSKTKRVFNSFIVMIIVSIGTFLIIYLNSYPQFVSDVEALISIDVIIISLLSFILPFVIIGTFIGYVAVIIKDRSSATNKKTLSEDNNKPFMISDDIDRGRSVKGFYSIKKRKKTKLHPLLKILIIIGGGILISNVLMIPVMFILIYGGATLGSYGHYFFAIFFGVCFAAILGLLWFIFRKK